MTGYGMIDAACYQAQAQAVDEAARLVGIVSAWHRDVHGGGFVVCQKNPCLAINRQRAADATNPITGL